MSSNLIHGTDLESVIRQARDKEQTTGRYQYVVYSKVSARYEVTERMPFLGEWYDADGIRHG